MKIKLNKFENDYWSYIIDVFDYSQKEYDYIFKHLDFEKIYQYHVIYFFNSKKKQWFHETYINSNHLDRIYSQSPEGYQYLKDNWGKHIFTASKRYKSKQELKTVVNKVINVEFKSLHVFKFVL